MENMPLEIETLIIAEIAQAITPEEQAHLNELRDNDPAIQVLSDKLYGQLGGLHRKTNEEMEESVRHIIALANAGKVYKRRSILVGLRFPLIAAASLLGIFLLATKGYESYLGKIPELARQENDENTYLFDGNQWMSVKDGELNINEDGQLYSNNTRLSTPEKLFTRSNAAIQVGRRKTLSITLADGSSIVANAGSTIRLPKRFAENERKVFISGEAYCDIASRAGHPFIVSYPTGKVEVLGTAFNVRTYDNETPSIAVVEGRVKVDNQGATTILTEGQKATYIQGQYRVAAFDVNVVTAWKKNVVFFPNASKQEVESAFEIYYGKKLSIDRAFPKGMGRINIVRSEKESEFVDQLPHDLKEVPSKDGILHVQ
ncbi:FecR family protein [Chitinophaga pinensis]|uniref:Anti-FecI sigma factor, FecR n=1 Tax=Chitinophaga pinensis (strain ATCC 43595 / DSM 2588 / LMG 13176 / NBRC 15968 / NCIMB 11800 / UQM 2034) TaxID=485918 RepID=A0A979G5W6_CHIPD|nr:FecR domain-containing protein [Chitinophaga pinensis]ACU61268.1 anti-FecI sigma factor, FecR [Chitinophaga pinensis DSM 2588]